ncbi:MAG: hypothetical protein NXI31_01850 [bacterium]|nr:hypothetical protein [bacterium]
MRSLSVVVLVALLGGCSVTASGRGDDAVVGPRFVEPERLAAGDWVDENDVITTMRLRFVSAAAVQGRLEDAARVPAGVRVAWVGDGSAMIVQGPGRDVAAVVADVQAFDVR